MRIGIQDIDGHNFPNFALMRIAAFHRLRGDSVEMAVPLFGDYDRVYQSKIFTFSPDNTTPWLCEVVKGGIASCLPDEIERSTAMDYSLYPQHRFSIQFFSREQDLYRIQRCREFKILPFVMPFRDYENMTQPSQYCKDLAAWVNKPQIFGKVPDFKDFEPRKGFFCSSYLNP